MSKLLIATHNPAKFNEFVELLSNYKLTLVSLKDLSIKAKAPEEADNFKDNALAKAKFYYNLAQLPTLADDSGLEIDALDGWPGASSRRIFGVDNHEATDEELIQETLRRLKDMPWEKRTAHFSIAVALVLNQAEFYVAEGQGLTGYIAAEPTTTRISGYPFRSLFYVSEYNKLSADLSSEERDEVGFRHRPIMLDKLEPYLKRLC
ncbi:MAG: non-canonical purine NTP pyrophosphatase [Candidatus Kerfeldbacteria bacterium]|nr:non-canonical purine NTP pyrophosphatase [Candidatus Kerfeldbacteria bacterium]